LDLIPGRVERLPAADVTVPHMGWNTLSIERGHPLVEDVGDDYAYFVHSYATRVSGHTVAATEHGRRFAAIAANERGNVVGTQFHPEKSGETGLALLANFVDFAEAWNAGAARDAVARN
jgi:glutamine amidotransferase